MVNYDDIKIRMLILFLCHHNRFRRLCSDTLFFFVIFVFFFSGSVLILLIFRDQIVHVGFGFSEFHFVHSFTSIPMQEGFSSEHSSELFSDSLEHFLDGGGVSYEGNGHFQSLRGDITDGGFDVVGDPFNEVRTVFVLDVQHLFVDFFSGHSSSE